MEKAQASLSLHNSTPSSLLHLLRLATSFLRWNTLHFGSEVIQNTLSVAESIGIRENPDYSVALLDFLSALLSHSIDATCTKQILQLLVHVSTVIVVSLFSCLDILCPDCFPVAGTIYTSFEAVARCSNRSEATLGQRIIAPATHDAFEVLHPLRFLFFHSQVLRFGSWQSPKVDWQGGSGSDSSSIL